MYSQATIEKLSKQLLALASQEIRIRDAYLFGSYASGFAGEYSDIDLAIISDDFVGSYFDDATRLDKFVLKTCSAIEVHPFRAEDFTPDNPFVAEILRTGKRITWN